MTEEELIAAFSSLRTWEAGGIRSPNKPLLILFALGKLDSEGAERLKFADCEQLYAILLKEFGKTGVPKPRPEYAFYRLKNDCGGSIWSIYDPNNVLVETPAGDVRISDFRQAPAGAGFSSEVLEAFQRKPDLIGRIAETMLSAHFPETLHSDILGAVGLTSSQNVSTSRRRDSKFRPNVLTAYGYKCTVCGFSLKLDGNHIALEAAHIKWHQAGGPEEVGNGLALCCLHHNLFDRGAFTISDGYRLKVSPLVNSTGADTIYSFDGKTILLPRNSEWYPKAEYLNWHKMEVFQYRDL
jgi:putative restriction endonuclease